MKVSPLIHLCVVSLLAFANSGSSSEQSPSTSDEAPFTFSMMSYIIDNGIDSFSRSTMQPMWNHAHRQFRRATQPSASSIYFVQKLEWPETVEIVLFGDIHGPPSAHLLIQALIDFYAQGIIDDSFRITEKNPNIRFIFLGNYVDRGAQLSETLMMLYKFAGENRDKVILLRGTHESWSIMNQHDRNTWAISPSDLDLQSHLMPLAVFIKIGEKYHQFNHGGIEIADSGLKAWLQDDESEYRDLVLDKRVSFCSTFPSSNHCKKVWGRPDVRYSGYQWADFSESSGYGEYQHRRGPAAGKALVNKWLDYVGVDKLFHGHQYSSWVLEHLMKNNGLISMWSNRVVQVFSGGAIFYLSGGKGHDKGYIPEANYAIVHPGKADKEEWKMQQCHPVYGTPDSGFGSSTGSQPRGEGEANHHQRLEIVNTFRGIFSSKSKTKTKTETNTNTRDQEYRPAVWAADSESCSKSKSFSDWSILTRDEREGRR